jgi:hypothetical protein
MTSADGGATYFMGDGRWSTGGWEAHQASAGLRWSVQRKAQETSNLTSLN